MKMKKNAEEHDAPAIERLTMEVDIACVGFGPAMGGFLTTLTRAWNENPADPAFESKVAPGLPLQVLCYERADDIAAGVSGVVTAARGIRASFPDLNPADIPMARRSSRSEFSTCSIPLARAGDLCYCDSGIAFCEHSVQRWVFATMRSICRGLRVSCTRTADW